jgi:threonylcarbamoyladenosine tRNA methylthiotransferase MtaB
MIAEEAKNKIITFGCRLNAFESETIKKALQASDQKNLIVFNSCAVTNQAEKDLVLSIKKIRKENPSAKIVLTGCASQINPQKYAKMSEIDLIIGNDKKSDIASYDLNSAVNFKENDFQINSQDPNNHADQLFFESQKKSLNFLDQNQEAKIRVNNIMSVKSTAPQLVSYFENQTRAFLEIQNGCNHRCTFCVIPYGRGNSRSVALGSIVAQAQKMVANGHNEIVLTGVDISDYGKDLPVALTLSQMIKRLLKLVPELKRLRLSSIDVAEIDDEFLEILASEPRLMPYLHLSIQSGDDLILKRMKRRHNRQQILDFCEKARKICPQITFGADIIAGFPTEDVNAFNNSLKIIEEADIIFSHIFPYSSKAGTPASKMPQLPPNLIKERAKILRECAEKQLQKYLSLQINQEFEILMEKNDYGKTHNFLNVKLIDYIKTDEINNKFLFVKIIKTQENMLIGKLINKN